MIRATRFLKRTAAQGSLIVFVVLIFWFAWKQNKIDEEYGMAEEE